MTQDAERFGVCPRPQASSDTTNVLADIYSLVHGTWYIYSFPAVGQGVIKLLLLPASAKLIPYLALAQANAGSISICG